MAVTSSSGVRLHYVEEGVGDPPFLFIHGWCCDHTFFQPQFDHFKPNHRVISLDLRGCGESDKPESGYDIPTMTDDVAALCREARIERPVVVGHSLGAMMAVDLAARHPSIPRAVVADDPGPLAISPESRATFEAFIAALEGPDSACARSDFIAGMFLPDANADQRQWITDTMCSTPLHVALGQIRGVLTWNGLGALRLMTAPLLVLRRETGGDNDPTRLLGLKADIRFGVTVGGGHFHQLEVPEQVNLMIERFVKSL